MPPALRPTGLRFLSMNVQTSLAGGWPSRLPGTLKVIKGVAPSILACQETERAMAAEIAAGLGQHWRYQRSFQNSIFWDSRKWTQEGRTWERKLWDGTDRKTRSVLLVKLRSRSTGGYVWAGSTHLSANSTGGSPEIRLHEARELAKLLDGWRYLIVGVDLNDRGKSVRAELKDGGIRSLRDKAPTASALRVLAKLGGKLPLNAGGGIDDVLTKAGVQPTFAEVVRNPSSDHDAIRVSCTILPNH